MLHPVVRMRLQDRSPDPTVISESNDEVFSMRLPNDEGRKASVIQEMKLEGEYLYDSQGRRLGGV